MKRLKKFEVHEQHIKIGDYEFKVPSAPDGIWKEGDVIYTLHVLPISGTSVVVKFNHIGTVLGKVGHQISDLEWEWDLKKPFIKYTPSSQFDMTRNKVVKGELVPCV